MVSGQAARSLPLGEIGFLRISANKRAINAPMHQTRILFQQFLSERAVEWICDDLHALDANAETSEQVTDFYLAELAKQHGMKLATLDRNLSHPGAELIGA